MVRPMRLLFVTPEVAPYTGSTPTGDLAWALPKALKSRGHEVTVLAPLYGFVDPTARGLARRLRKLGVELGGGERTVFEVYDARTAAGVDLMFLGHETLFRPVSALPTDEDLEAGVRFGAFCKAALQVARADEKGFDLLHCHDWQTALVPVLRRLEEVEIPTVLTVHDASSRGAFSRELLGRLGLPSSLFAIDGLEFYGKVCLLKGGVLEADRVTTVSPSYARELSREGALGGLEGVFRERAGELSGIVGGVDASIWNPATDPHLDVRFDPMDRGGKRRNKAGLQRELGLPARDEVPLVGVLGALHTSSGLDALARIITRLMRNDVQLAVVADRQPLDESLALVLEEHARRWPDRLAVRRAATDPLVHRTLGGSDFLLVPPSQPPGGALQQRAHRYGALPIGLAAGAFADTVVDCDGKLVTGNGFVFTEASDEGLLAATQRAIAAFGRRSELEKVRARALRSDHGWDRSAYLYERLYEATARR